jgi:uroporphyrinogen decarboxylase
MRQAGRYLPEYREVRKDVDFFTLCETPDLVSEVTRQPVDLIGVDAAIIFSDILLLPRAMGMDLAMVKGKGPQFGSPVRSEADVDALRRVGAEELSFVMDALETTKRDLAGQAPLIGFSGAPWTLFTYMVEGQGSKDFTNAKEMMYRNPALTHRLLTMLADSVADYLAGQLAAGADVVQLFDTWGGILRPADYREFSLHYIRRVIAQLPSERGPVIVFSKGVHHSYEELAASGADVIGVDWTIGLDAVRQRVGDGVALQGNLDPHLLFAPPERITEETRAMLASHGSGPGLIANLGHGIGKDTDPDHARAFVQAVKNYAIEG